MSRFLAIDFETSHYAADSACSIGLVLVEHNKIIHSEHHLIRPPQQKILFTEIHGIRWNDLKDEPSFPTIWNKVSPLFDEIDFVAAHNAAFDQRILIGTCASYGIRPPQKQFLCTVDLARKTWGIYPTKLPNVCQQLKIDLNHHDALSDAMACAKIVIASQTKREAEMTL